MKTTHKPIKPTKSIFSNLTHTLKLDIGQNNSSLA